MSKILPSHLGYNMFLITVNICLYLHVTNCENSLPQHRVLTAQIFSFLSLFLFSLATKVQTLVDFNDVPSEEKLPLVCEICVFIAFFLCCLKNFSPNLVILG